MTDTFTSIAKISSVGAYIEAVNTLNARNARQRTSAPARKPRAKTVRKPVGIAVSILSLFLVVAIFA